MKKVILVCSVLLAMILYGCGGVSSSLTGTWELDHVEIEGSYFSLEELESIGEYDGEGVISQIVIKDGGKALISDGNNSGMVDWEMEGDEFTIDYSEATFENGCISVDWGAMAIFYYHKVSDNQTYVPTSIASEAEEVINTKVEETEVEITSEIEPEIESEIIIEPEEDTTIEIKQSTDKHTWYIKNYVGKNCASFGYTSIGGDRLDKYGDGRIELVFVTPDGSYIDIMSDDDLQQYSVTGQNIEPNTELNYIFMQDSDGEEMEGLVSSQSIEEIVLSVKKVGSADDASISLTSINVSNDKHVSYVADFVGRNLASCGYVSLGGNYMHKFKDVAVELIIITTDGSYIDPEDEEAMKNYVVIAQNIAPNTEIMMEFMKDSDGNEYDGLVDYSNIEEIELTVKAVN